mgnify:CR=1 FL=1
MQVGGPLQGHACCGLPQPHMQSQVGFYIEVKAEKWWAALLWAASTKNRRLTNGQQTYRRTHPGGGICNSVGYRQRPGVAVAAGIAALGGVNLDGH